jgi:FkbM family methyltransferase
MSFGFSPSSHRLVTLERQIRFKVKIFFMDGWLRPKRPMNMLRLGTYYGGWWIPRVDPSEGAAVCVGAGLDVSFDLELQRLGYRVYTVDPTPASIEYVTRTAPELTLVPLGVWEQVGELEFEQNGTYTDSWAIGTGDGRSNSVVSFPVTTVKELVASLDEGDLAILKLDIEGAEHAVIRSMIQDKMRPRCICIEFDDQRLRKVLRSVRLLDHYGYDLYQIENYNFTFVLR